jgi:hypothetical protein
MKKIICILLFVAANTHAQTGDYWQQHVSYTIEATLIDSNHSVDGKLSVIYTNNSPDTLKEVYFHLYSNAFRPGSMMHERAKELNDVGLRNKFDNYKPSDWGGYTIHKISADGSDARYSVTGTIMKVVLSSPLAPKATVKLGCDFHEQIPLQTRRSGWMNADSIKYSMSQWYPKVCEYDREGWHNQEYISREFYGVWGEFDVTLHVPSKFCVGTTGQCQNPDEVGWGYDSIAHGIKRGKFYPSSPLIAHYPPLITWHFKAENVHDFAWVAHEYIHEWDTWNDTVTVHCLYKPTEEKLWAEAMKNTFFMLEHHSKKVGWYQYRNFTNTHGGDGGMEYPQLVMDGSPNAGLIMHEGGHQWFYGMLGNNETRYAFLDEGFTEFIEMTGMEAYYGRHNERSPYRDTSWLTKMFIPEYDSRRGYYAPYLDLATSGYEEPIYIPHDWARENVNAGQVYFKTLNGLAQLEYVLGDSVFWAGMKEYFRRWHFKHPSLLDFQRTMEDVSGTKLDWYFDQWFHTTRTIDYEGCGVSSEKQSDGSFKTKVKLYNNDVAVMPIDLTLHYDDGTSGIATIPLALNQGVGYQKQEAGRLFFPPWDWVSKKYEGTITTQKEVSSYEIDSSCRLMDLRHANNYSSWFHTKIDVSLWKQLNNPAPMTGSYSIFRPILWYEETSKFNLGIGAALGENRVFNGDVKLIVKTGPKYGESYLLSYDSVNSIFHSTLAYKEPRFEDYIDFDLNGKFNTKWLGNLTTISASIGKMYGISHTLLSIDHVIRPTYLYLGPTHTLSLTFDLTGRGENPNLVYPVYHRGWDNGSVLTIGGKYSFSANNGATQFGIGFEHGNTYQPNAPSFFGFSNKYEFFGGWNARASQHLWLANEVGLQMRLNAVGQFGYVPSQKYYQLGRANNATEDKDAFWRAVSSVSQHFSTESHFYLDGGAGVRGFRSGADYGGYGFSTELTLPNPTHSWGWLPASFNPMVFFDAGYVGDKVDLKQIAKGTAIDAGVGLKWNILSWLPWQLQGVAGQYASIPTISFYFPVYLNHPDDGKENFAFRYVISLGTTF